MIQCLAVHIEVRERERDQERERVKESERGRVRNYIKASNIYEADKRGNVQVL